MSGYENTDPNVLAKQAEQDLNSYEAKTGHHESGRAGKGAGESTKESGVDSFAANRFPGGNVTYGSQATGREIPPEEGGGVNPATGRMTKDKDFEGVDGPEDKIRQAQDERPGDQDVVGNVRQGGETRRP